MPSSVITALTSIVLILGGGSGIAALLLVRKQMRVLGSTADRQDADAGKTVSAAAIELIAPYREQVREARAEAKEAAKQAELANRRADDEERRVKHLEDELADQGKRITQLEDVIREGQLTLPPWPARRGHPH